MKKGDTVTIPAVNDAVWRVISFNKTHVHLRNIHDVMRWVPLDQIRPTNAAPQAIQPLESRNDDHRQTHHAAG